MEKQALQLGEKREFFWDDYILDTEKTTAQQRLHSPVYRETVMENDAPWEGNAISYYNILCINGVYRMYYIAQNRLCYHDTTLPRGREYERGIRICCAESTDGIHWIKPSLGLRKYHGSTDNNIILDATDDGFDNFYVFFDERARDYGEHYKAIASHLVSGGSELWYWSGHDGLRFTRRGKITDQGAFDSLNIVFFDQENQRYVCLYRATMWYGTENSLIATEMKRLFPCGISG